MNTRLLIVILMLFGTTSAFALGSDPNIENRPIGTLHNHHAIGMEDMNSMDEELNLKADEKMSAVKSRKQENVARSQQQRINILDRLTRF